MSNSKINFDDTQSIYKTDIPVMVNYLNYGNHLGYDSILSIIQEARMRWLKLNEMGEMSLENSTGYLVVDVALSYKSEAFHGDILDIDLYVENLKRRSFNFLYKITNRRTKNVVALAKTGHVFYDFNLKKMASMPKSFAQLMHENINLVRQ